MANERSTHFFSVRQPESSAISARRFLPGNATNGMSSMRGNAAIAFAEGQSQQQISLGITFSKVLPESLPAMVALDVSRIDPIPTEIAHRNSRNSNPSCRFQRNRRNIDNHEPDAPQP